MNIIVCICTEASPGVLQCITQMMGTQVSQGKHKIFFSLFSHFSLFPLISTCFQSRAGFQDVCSHSWAHAGCLVMGVPAAAQTNARKYSLFLLWMLLWLGIPEIFLVIKMFLSFYRYVYIDLWIFIHKNKDVHLLLQLQLRSKTEIYIKGKGGKDKENVAHCFSILVPWLNMLPAVSHF